MRSTSGNRRASSPFVGNYGGTQFVRTRNSPPKGNLPAGTYQSIDCDTCGSKAGTFCVSGTGKKKNVPCAQRGRMSIRLYNESRGL